MPDFGKISVLQPMIDLNWVNALFFTMSYCLNPVCPKPQNPSGTNFCHTCGSRLLLRERYRAIKPIGQGGFGRTFLAVDEDIPSKPACVIKQFVPLSEGTQQAQKAAELFQQEAVRLDELGKHPQIPELLAHFEQDSQQYLVQEFIEGENLAQELSNNGPFNETQIRDLLLDLLPVLQFVHDHQVIHRDIKPANLIRRTLRMSPTITQAPLSTFSGGAGGQLVLVDFGAAKVLTGSSSVKPGTVIGSPEYVAPEQTRGQAVFASDLYSLGATCIHLLTLMSPFDLFDIYEDTWVWRDYLTNNPVSSKLAQILDRMLALNPSQRYSSALQVLKDLQPGRQVTFTPTPSPSIPASPTPSLTPSPTPSPAIPTPHAIPTITHHYCLTGHFNSVTSVAFSPDGATLASGSGDKTIEMWNLTTGKRWYTLTGHQDWVRAVAFSPDGQWLASASSDKTVILWQLRTGKQLWALSGHQDGVYSVAFSPDSQTLLSGDRQGVLQLWPLSATNPPRWSPLRILNHHREGVYAVALSPDGRMFASGSRDQMVQLGYFDSDGKPQRNSLGLPGHQDWVRAVAFSSNSRYLASGGRDGKILIWNISPSLDPQYCYTLSVLSGDVWSVAFSPDSQWLVSGSGKGTIDLWNVQTGKLLTTWAAHQGDVLSVAFSPDGQFLASGSSDKTIKIWQTPVIRSSIKSTPAFG